MVIGAFPLAKLFGLLLKQVSKPLANAVKEHAKTSPRFRTYVCLPPAHLYNWIEVKTKMWILNLGRPVNVPVLKEEMAIELGANLLGEGIIFVVAAAVLLNEYIRSVRKESAKEEALSTELTTLSQTLQELFFQTEQQSAQIKELMRTVYDLESRVVHKPWAPKKVDNEIEIKEQSLIPITVDANTAIQTNYAYEQNNGIIVKSINLIMDDLWGPKEAESKMGILDEAVNYIYRDVYGLPVS